MASYNELLKEYKVLAKRADQRLRSLERLSGQEGYKNVESFAYARAQKDISKWSGEKATRFSTKAPENFQSLQGKLNDIKTFLGSATSTKTGITRMYEERVNKMNKEMGTNFSWQDMAKMFENERSKKLSEIMGSKTYFKTMGVINDLGDDPEKIKQLISGDLRVSEDLVVQAQVEELLRNGLTRKDLF